MSTSAYDEAVAKLEEARKELDEALASLAEPAIQTDATTALPHILRAIKAADTLQEFVVQDLGTAVNDLQRLDTNVETLAEYVSNQQGSINDVSSTLAALVDFLVGAGVVDPEALMKHKASIMAQAAAEGPDLKSN